MSDERQKMDDLLGWFQRSVSRSEMDNLRAEILGRFDAVVAERNAAHERLADWEETHRQVMAEACGDGGPLDARHCTCVPELRRGIRELTAEVDGLRAERDHHRVANEALRERVANHIAAFEAIARVGCYEAPESSCHRHGSDPEEFCAACLAELMLSDRDGEQLAGELDRLRARVAELEDAERIAWCLTVGISQRDEHEGDATWLVPVYGVWRLVMRREQKGTQRVVLNKGDYPVLTPEARALIDAARDNSTEREGAEGGQG